MRCLALVAVAGLILAVSGTAEATTLQVSLQPPSTAVLAGQDFWLTLHVASGTPSVIPGFDVQMLYDPSKLLYLGFEPLLTPVWDMVGTPPSGGAWVRMDLGPGGVGETPNFVYSWFFGSPPPITEADLLRVQFRALGGLDAAGTDVTYKHQDPSMPAFSTADYTYYSLDLFPAHVVGVGGGAGQIPEPLTMLGMFLGLGGVGAYIKRRRMM